MATRAPERGEMRERLTLLVRQAVPNAQGGRVATYVPGATIPAQLAGAAAVDETLRAGGVVGATRYDFVVRLRPDVSVTMRVSWRPRRAPAPRVLQILGIAPLPADPRRYQVLACAEAAA